MIAELAAFNAAFGVVKAAVGNGRDIMSCAKQIGDMIGAEEQLRARGERKKNGFLAQISGKTANDFEEFMAIEKMKQSRKELLSAMQLYGRGGLKDEFLKFEAEARKKRRADAKAREAKKQAIIEWTVGSLLFIVMLGGLTAIGYFIGQDQGRW
jgi:hypothetical protein